MENTLVEEIKEIEENYQFYIEDVKRINKAIYNHYGIPASFNEVYNLWADMSKSYSAGWLTVPNNEEEIIDTIKRNIL